MRRSSGVVSRVLSPGRSLLPGGDHSSVRHYPRQGGPPLPPRSCLRGARLCSALLRMGFTVRPLSPAARCALTAPFHPYPCEHGRFAFCGTFLQVTLTGLRQHPALRSPDFPRRSPLQDPKVASECRRDHLVPLGRLTSQPRGLAPVVRGNQGRAPLASTGPVHPFHAARSGEGSPTVGTTCAHQGEGPHRLWPASSRWAPHLATTSTPLRRHP